MGKKEPKRRKAGSPEAFEELFSVGDAARILGVHPNTIRVWTAQGLLKAYRLGRRGDRRIPRSEIEKLLGRRL